MHNTCANAERFGSIIILIFKNYKSKSVSKDLLFQQARIGRFPASLYSLSQTASNEDAWKNQLTNGRAARFNLPIAVHLGLRWATYRSRLDAFGTMTFSLIEFLMQL